MGPTLRELGLVASVRSAASLARVVNLLPLLPKTFTNKIKAKVWQKGVWRTQALHLGAQGRLLLYALGLELHLCLKGTSGLWASHPWDPKRPVRSLSPGSRGAAGGERFPQCRRLRAKRSH